jgi:hypothetical protein
VLIYKENERGKQKNSRVALLVQHNWKPFFFIKKNLPSNYHNKWNLLIFDPISF